MGLFLAAAGLYIPPFIRKRKLAMLFQSAAVAFQSPVPPSDGLSYDDALLLFARFTREQAEKTVRQGNRSEVQSRLFHNTCEIGRQLKTDFNINTLPEVMRMSRIIYRLLKIDFQGDSRGEIVIHRCFFSTFYSEDICRLVSALDAGLLAGLSGGGKLHFTRRITEGHSCCRASLYLPGGSQ
jgi:hypothetical protein